MKRRLLYAFAAPLLVFAAVTSPRGSQQVGQLIEQPERWIPFSAFVRITEPGVPIVNGRFSRSSDGSTRTETGDGTNAAILINNVSRQLNYKYLAGAHWESRPLVLPPGGYKPLGVRLDNREFSFHGETVAGFEVWRHVSEGGSLSYRAPALNMFALSRRTPQGVVEEEYYDITIGEPDRALFEPPPGVLVKHLEKPGGIVFVPRKQAEKNRRND